MSVLEIQVQWSYLTGSRELVTKLKRAGVEEKMRKFDPNEPFTGKLEKTLLFSYKS